MERDAIDLRAVQLRLHLGDAREDVGGERARVDAQPRLREQPLDLRVVAMVVLVVVVMAVLMVVVVVMLVLVLVLVARVGGGASRAARPVDLEALADERAAFPLSEPDAEAPHAHRLHGAGHDRGRDAEIDQRGHRHVAGDPGAGLEVQVKAAQPLH